MRLLSSIMSILLLSSCASSPDPRVLAGSPSSAVPTTAAYDGSAYSVQGTGVTQIILLFPGGTVLDPKGKEGAVELLCSSMVSGGASGISPADMDKELDSLAVGISVSPQREYTVVSASFLPEDEDRAVYLMNSIIASPDLDRDRVELNRSLMKQSIILKNESAVEQAFMTFRKHYYKGDPRQESPNDKSVENIEINDMRSLHHRIFSNKPLMGIIGSISEKNADIIKNMYKGRFRTSELGPPLSPEYGIYYSQAVQRHCVIAMIKQAPSMADRSHAANVAADLIIGSGGFNSMLVKEVRTRQGLAYSANSFYQAKPLWGIFGIIVITEPGELSKVKDAIKRVFSQIENGISDDDVAWAKATIINRASTEYNTPAGIISHSMDNAFYDIEDGFEGMFLINVSALVKDDVQKAASSLVKGPWVEVVINDQQ